MAVVTLTITLAVLAVTATGSEKCFGQNEYYSCRLKSDQSCSYLKIDSTTQPVINNDATSIEGDTIPYDKYDSLYADAEAKNSSRCKSQCYCGPGLARDENNVCVPYDQCNKPCSSGEIKDYCPTDCPYDYCPKKELRSVKCLRPNPCPKPQCKCRFNSRRSDNVTCISTRDCPTFECKKPFEIYDPCPPLCPNERRVTGGMKRRFACLTPSALEKSVEYNNVHLSKVGCTIIS